MFVDLEPQLQTDVLNRKEESFSISSDYSEKMFRLPGVGFHPWMEIDALLRDFLKTREEGKNPEETLKTWLEKTRTNIEGYWLEYIEQRLVLPIDLEIAEVDGQRRIASGEAVWVDTIGSWERNGSVKDSAIIIENFLLSAPEGSIAVLVSPGGNEYPDTQTYIFWVNLEGKMESMTIRTDPKIEDNESFLFNSDLNFRFDASAPLESRVEAIIRNPLLLATQDGCAYSPESIIKTILITKSEQGVFGGRDFAELCRDFANKDDLLWAEELVKLVINEFTDICAQTIKDSDYILNDEICKFLEAKLGEIILKLSYIKRQFQDGEINFETAVLRLANLSHSDYREELGYLQTIPGCAGGGLDNYTNNGFGPRKTWEYRPGVCRICKKTSRVGPCEICSSCEKRM